MNLEPVYDDSPSFSCQDLYLHSLSAPSGTDIWKASHKIIKMLVDKNISYGDSALSPIRIFSKSGPREQLHVRIDDKLNRIKNNKSFVGDNDLDDLIGYLILKKVYNAKKPVYNGNWDPEATDQLK